MNIVVASPRRTRSTSYDTKHKNKPEENARRLDALAQAALDKLPAGSERMSSVEGDIGQNPWVEMTDDRGILRELAPLGERIARLLMNRHPGDEPIVFELSNLTTATRSSAIGTDGIRRPAPQGPTGAELRLIFAQEVVLRA